MARSRALIPVPTPCFGWPSTVTVNARVDARLRPEVEPLAVLGRHGDAEVPRAHAREEVDHLDGHLLGRDDEIAFVLAAFVVDEHDRLAGAHVLEDLGNRRERHHAPPTMFACRDQRVSISAR